MMLFVLLKATGREVPPACDSSRCLPVGRCSAPGIMTHLFVSARLCLILSVDQILSRQGITDRPLIQKRYLLCKHGRQDSRSRSLNVHLSSDDRISSRASTYPCPLSQSTARAACDSPSNDSGEMLQSGFRSAPVTRIALFSTAAISLLASLADVKFLFHVQVVPHLWVHGQWWRTAIWQLGYANAGEVLFGCLLLYHMRVVERMFGSRKYGVSLPAPGILRRLLTSCSPSWPTRSSAHLC